MKQRPAGSRRWRLASRRAIVVLVLAAAAWVLASGDPAWAQVHGGHYGPSADVSVFMRALLLVAASVAIGMAVPRSLGGAPAQAAQPILTVSAAIAALAGALSIKADDPSALLAVALVPATLALPGLRTRPRAGPITGLLVWLLLAVQATVGQAGADRAAGILYTLCGTLGLAVATAVATGETRHRSALPRRLLPWAAGAAAIATVTGLLRGWTNGVRPDATVWWSSFGRLTVLEVVLLTGAATLGLGTALRGRVGPRLTRAAAMLVGALVAGALVAGAVLAAVPAPPEPPVTGVPMLRSLAVADDRLPVLVVPQRPGWNLVHIGADKAAAGLDPARLTRATGRPGITGSWALVRLPAGRSRLWVGHGEAVSSLPVNTGHSTPDDRQFTGADGPECASAGLGAVLAGSRRALASCPAQQLTPGDAEALRAMVRFAAGRGVSAISVEGDDSPRGRLAQAQVRAAAAAHHLKVTGPGQHPLFVVGGWAAAQATLLKVSTGRLPAEGSYLAPWLLTGPLLSIKASPQLALRFDTEREGPARYLGMLGEQFPGESPTAVGYASWRGSADLTDPLRLYAAAQMFAPGPGHNYNHDHDQATAWVPNGSVTAVTGPLVS